jgi:hypothetical protein
VEWEWFWLLSGDGVGCSLVVVVVVVFCGLLSCCSCGVELNGSSRDLSELSEVGSRVPVWFLDGMLVVTETEVGLETEGVWSCVLLLLLVEVRNGIISRIVRKEERRRSKEVNLKCAQSAHPDGNIHTSELHTYGEPRGEQLTHAACRPTTCRAVSSHGCHLSSFPHPTLNTTKRSHHILASRSPGMNHHPSLQPIPHQLHGCKNLERAGA